MVDKVNFPRAIVLKETGISYLEEGPNMLFMNIVVDEKEGTVNLVAIMDQDEMSATFGAMTFGKVVYTVPLLEILEKVQQFANSYMDNAKRRLEKYKNEHGQS